MSLYLRDEEIKSSSLSTDEGYDLEAPDGFADKEDSYKSSIQVRENHLIIQLSCNH